MSKIRKKKVISVLYVHAKTLTNVGENAIFLHFRMYICAKVMYFEKNEIKPVMKISDGH